MGSQHLLSVTFEIPPLHDAGRAAGLERVAVNEMALVIEVAVKGRVRRTASIRCL
jgi:hypothetical protein